MKRNRPPNEHLPTLHAINKQSTEQCCRQMGASEQGVQQDYVLGVLKQISCSEESILPNSVLVEEHFSMLLAAVMLKQHAATVSFVLGE